MGHILPSNRVASLAAFIAGLAGCATALAQVWPNPALNEAALIAGSVGTLAGPLSHVVGSWFWDRTPAGQAQALARGNVEQPAAPDDPDPSEWLGNRSPTPDPVGDPPAAPQPPAPTPAPPPAA